MTHAPERGAAAANGAIIELPGYRAIVARGALAGIGEILSDAAAAFRYAIVTDDNVGPLYGELVRAAIGADRARIFSMPAGESHKTRETWARLTDDLLADRYGRDAAIIALGGGVIGDLAGFVAATYMRGIPVVQVPTSLLAMVDASIGGKTGVDTPAGKNLVGAHHPPAVVVADPDVLRTLPVPHLRAGLAEAIKHGIIADARYFDAVAGLGGSIVQGSADPDTVLSVIAEGMAIKARVVRLDERENGIRKTLNLGHTLGHAIEACSGYALLHGEAVAIGTVLESAIAERMGVADAGTTDRIRDAMTRMGLPVVPPAGMAVDGILTATRSDKKARGGTVEYALPARIGAMSAADHGWGTAVPDSLVREILAELGG